GGGDVQGEEGPGRVQFDLVEGAADTDRGHTQAVEEPFHRGGAVRRRHVRGAVGAVHSAAAGQPRDAPGEEVHGHHQARQPQERPPGAAAFFGDRRRRRDHVRWASRRDASTSLADAGSEGWAGLPPYTTASNRATSAANSAEPRASATVPEVVPGRRSISPARSRRIRPAWNASRSAVA